MKAKLAPAIEATGVPGFLLWARRDQPALYRSMVLNLPEVAQFESALQNEGVGGLLDVLKGFGSSLASSAGKIGTFVSKNALTIAATAVPLVVAVKQASVAKSQVKLAQAQLPPMQTAVVEGQSVPVQMVNGQWQRVPVDGGIIGAPVAMGNAPGVPQWVWLAGAGGAALLLIMMLRR